MNSREVKVGVNGQLYRYRFVNPWFALNQHNYKEYKDLPVSQRKQMLAFFKGIGYWEEQRVMVELLDLQTIQAKFKNQPMMMFKGGFVSNVRLPEYIGLGKSVLRGFGAICLEV